MKKSVLLLATLLSICSCGGHQTVYFTVTWLNYDQMVLEVDEKVAQGTMPSYDGALPTRESDEEFNYFFVSWDKELTPVEANVTYTAVFDRQERSKIVRPSHRAGFYDEPFSLTLDAPKGFDVYYSLDNGEPTTKYTAPIEISDNSSSPNRYSAKQGISSLDVYYPQENVDKGNLIKAIGVNRETGERGEIQYFNYFVGFQNKNGYSDLPIIALSADEGDLFDYERGIYVTGKIYDESEHTGYPETYPANYTQKGKEWERKANFQFFDEDRSLALDQNIGIRIHGGWSRAFNQKSFNLYARKEYSGASTFGKQFFGDINAHSLMLRNGGYRDTSLTKIRDSLNQDLSAEEGFDVQVSFPVIVFLNGEYWGIYNLQERYSDNYVQEHHGVNKDNVLIVKDGELDEGREEDFHQYEELIAFFQDNRFDDGEAYQLAQTYIDVNEFASYMSTQLYVGNIDWPANNVRVYKDAWTPGSKWHFMMFDSDDSGGIVPAKCDARIDPFVKEAHWASGPLEEDCLLGLMFSKLIANNAFRALFRDAFMRIGQNRFSSQKVDEYLKTKGNLLRIPMTKNYQRFVNQDYDETYFDAKLNVIKTFFEQRYDYAIGFLNEHVPS